MRGAKTLGAPKLPQSKIFFLVKFSYHAAGLNSVKNEENFHVMHKAQIVDKWLSADDTKSKKRKISAYLKK